MRKISFGDFLKLQGKLPGEFKNLFATSFGRLLWLNYGLKEFVLGAK
jgi:hypothetical protein